MVAITDKKRKIGSQGRAEQKAKKRKLQDRIPDVPEANEDPAENDLNPNKHPNDQDVEAQDTTTDVASRKARSAKTVAGKDKKTKLRAPAAADATLADRENIEPSNSGNGGSKTVAPRKSKKDRKAEKKALIALQKETESARPPLGQEQLPDVAPENPASKSEKRPSKKRKVSSDETASHRFIVFVGNLPFSATTDSIRAHFSTLKPISIRHLTKKDEAGTSRGCAFVEFAGYDTMNTCLRMFHHSAFDDGHSKPRKINVELTAGGGGAKTARKDKIAAKNVKLQEERARKIQAQKLADAQTIDSKDTNHGIHPSRLGNIDQKGPG